jgi:single-strand DNA-binding protein
VDRRGIFVAHGGLRAEFRKVAENGSLTRMGRREPPLNDHREGTKFVFIEIGRLTQDVAVRTVTVNETEKRVMNNRLAVRVGKEDSAFIDVTAWNGTAEFIGAHFKKGDELFVEGELRSRIVKGSEKELSCPFILIARVKFTHGNRRAEDTA